MKITHDDKTFTITGQQWAGTYPLDDLGKWLAFYRRQRADFPKAGAVYDATIAGLEALAQELQVSA
ncbi:hypothetical protein [Paracoccus fontiphilus]|uniref:Uncharacterized protein n=1 Tax=Paracoccus fontiphilus TaxID=1815556 RepID=A0ABV7IJB9_9RHOB|nr:hypothetical protein [Paracoccus fontiphilus]